MKTMIIGCKSKQSNYLYVTKMFIEHPTIIEVRHQNRVIQ